MILFVIGCISAIFVIRAMMIKAAPSVPAKIPKLSDAHIASYGERLSKLVRIPTVTNDEPMFYKMHEVMKDLFPLLWSIAEVTEVDGNLLFHWKSKNSDKPAILFMGHQDVVPANDEGWKYPPFSGEIANGCVWGRGAFDCKATIFCEMSAIEELLAEGFQPPCDVYISTSVNEETGGDGTLKIIKFLQDKGVSLTVALDEGGVIMEDAFPSIDRSLASIGIIEKGSMNVRIRAFSPGGHSSQPPQNTPIARLSAFVNHMEKKRPFKRKISPEVAVTFKNMAPVLPFKYRLLFANIDILKPIMEKILPKMSPMFDAWLGTTFCFTMCKGSDSTNSIPNEAYVICNLRITRDENMQKTMEILKGIAQKYDLEVELLDGWEASQSADISSSEYEYLTKILMQCYPDIQICPYLSLGGTDCRHFEVLTKNNFRITPLRISNQQLAAVHAPNENISIISLVETTNFYKEYIKGHQ